MNMPANVKLSKDEMLLVCNSEWILTKQAIISKTVAMFSDIAEQYKEVLVANDFKDFNLVEPRVFKGENYRQLPYVMLDFPRAFNKENIFAIRTFFWWGNFFSITLHVSGDHKRKYFNDENVILQFKDWNICVNEDEWQHHFDADNYQPLQKINVEEIAAINERSFIKLAKKIPLNEWNDVYTFLTGNFSEIIKLLAA
jgi:hypothetical protein